MRPASPVTARWLMQHTDCLEIKRRRLVSVRLPLRSKPALGERSRAGQTISVPSTLPSPDFIVVLWSHDLALSDVNSFSTLVDIDDLQGLPPVRSELRVKARSQDYFDPLGRFRPSQQAATEPTKLLTLHLRATEIE